MKKPDKPFIKNLGLICLRSRNFILRNREPLFNAAIFASKLGKSSNFWDSSNEKELSEPNDFSFFGYDDNVTDQRYNFTFWELHKPLYIKAKIKDKTIAHGNVNIHLYPNGTINLIVNISVISNGIKEIKEFQDIVSLLRPKNYSKDVMWFSKFGILNLDQLLEKIKNEVTSSLFKNKPEKIYKSDLHSAIRANTNCAPEIIAKTLIKGEYQTFPYSVNEFDNKNETLIITPRLLVCLLNLDKRKKRDSHLFWDIYKICEHTYYYKFIIKRYLDFLSDEVVKLQQYRLSENHRKIGKKEFRRFTIFNPHIIPFLHAFTKITKGHNPFLRKLIYTFQDGMKLSKERESIEKLMLTWKDEVSKWENGYSIIYKKILSPLRKMIIGL